MKQNRHYLNVLCHFGPVMLINRKFDMSCKLDISRNLSRGSVGHIGQGDQSDSSFFLPSRDYFALLFHLRN